MSDNQQDSAAQLAIEKEKTKRYFALLGVGGTIVLIVVLYFFNTVDQGNLKVTKDGFEVSIEKPLIQQVNSDNSQLKTGTNEVTFTTGSINDSVIRNVEQSTGHKITPDKFIGKNLIDKKGGYVIASGNPDAWQVDHNSRGYTNIDQSMVTFSSNQTAQVTVSRTPTTMVPGCTTIRCVVDIKVNLLLENGVIAAPPSVEYDDKLNIAFLTFTNQNNQGETYLKMVKSGGYWYEARADYNKIVTDATTKNDAINMVASFAAIQ
ncbi:MAG: hypothetical protein HQ472_11010 [Ignavibacteria bacterium]|nr:hypothetical protein [Ignavibacteria bacterium]